MYRNVQAVVVDEIKRSTESAQEERMKLKSELADELRRELVKKLNKVMVFGVISVAVSAVSVALWVLMAMGVF